MSIEATLYTDPGCPWAYSSNPALMLMRWRFGDGVDWTIRTIGLAEDPQRYIDRGYTPERQATGYVSFRARGMPFATEPRPRVAATGRACRVLVATRVHEPDKVWAVLRALQFGWFTAPLIMDEDEQITTALTRTGVLDADTAARIVAASHDDDVEAAYQEDRALTRSAAGRPIEAQGREANSDGAVRYTAPSIVFTAPDGRWIEVGGFQPWESYDTALANLDPTLARRGPTDDVAEIVGAFDHGLTTREVALLQTSTLGLVDDAAAETALIAATAAGAVSRESLGDGALWHPAA